MSTESPAGFPLLDCPLLLCLEIDFGNSTSRRKEGRT